MRLTKATQLQVGALGSYTFAPGLYAYVGSAQKNRRARIARHLRREKPLRWHIHYFRPATDVVAVTLCDGDRVDECRLVDHLVATLGAERACPAFWGQRLPVSGTPAPGARRCALFRHQRNRLAFRHVLHGDGVDAVAQARRRRPVRKDVPEVAIAPGAAHLGPDHAKRTILVLRQRASRMGRGKGRPPRPRLKLLTRTKKRIAACGANVGTRLRRADETPLPRGLSPCLPQDPVLLGRQSFSPLLFAEDEFVHKQHLPML